MSARQTTQDGMRPAANEAGALSMSLGPGWNGVRPYLMGLALLLVANLAVGALVTWPSWSASSATGSAARQTQQVQDTLEPALERARAVYGPVVRAEQLLDVLRQRVGRRSGSVSEVSSTLRAALDAAGLQTERITWQPQPMLELGLLQLQVDLPVRGRYRQLRRFLAELLDGPMFAVIERVGAATPSQNDASDDLLLQLRASVFVDPTLADAPAESMEEDTPGAAPPRVQDPVAMARSLRARLSSLPDIPLSPEDFGLNLDGLAMEQPEVSETRRNLFAFASLPTRPTPARVVEEPDEFVPEPVMPYELLGITRTQDGLLATVSDGDNVHLVAVDDVLPDGYRVARVTEIAVVLESGDRTTRLSLRKDDREP